MNFSNHLWPYDFKYINSSFANNQPEAEELALKILECLNQHPDLTMVVAALESTSVYSIHIANYLSSCEELMRFNVSIASSFNCIETFKGEIKVIGNAIEKEIKGLNPNAFIFFNLLMASVLSLLVA